MNFMLSERFRLEIHWNKTTRPEPGLILFEDTYFSGPALAQAEKINNNDNIPLDFCSQYTILIKGVYVAKFHWGEVKYNDNKTISLTNARLEFSPSIKGIPNLSDRDYLVIDTSGHENEKHLYNVLYPTYVVNEDSQLYDFRR
jgi:hypothetical protein